MPKVALHRAAAWPAADASAPAADCQRVLVVRCCRPQPFADAVRAARDRYPAATITALTHRGHDDMRRAAGVDDVEVVTGRQFGLWRTPFWPLARLRARRFDVVVIPQMDAEWEQHGNVYRLVAAIGARR